MTKDLRFLHAQAATDRFWHFVMSPNKEEKDTFTLLLHRPWWNVFAALGALTRRQATE